MPKEFRLILKNADKPGYTPDIDCYMANGGYEALKKSIALKAKETDDGKTKTPQEQIRDEVMSSGLRGRGGAGFSCGLKWSFVDRRSGKPIYMICNADESEPGTFKDRQIIHKDPHQLVEGMIISAFANDVHLAYIYIRGEFPEGARILNKALDEAREKGFLGKDVLGTGYDLEIHVHRGAGAYICGEETGLIESLEGKRAYPRIKLGGGLLEGRTLKAIIPGGSSAKVLKAGEKFQMKRPNKDGELESVEVDLLDLPYDFDSLMAAGTMSGSSAIIVMDDSVDIVEALANVSAFYAHESCGQCTPCREGSLWMSKALNRMTSGKGRKEDADYLTHIATNIQGRTICAFGEACSWPVLSFVKKFKDEFEARGAADEAAQLESNQKGTVNSAN